MTNQKPEGEFEGSYSCCAKHPVHPDLYQCNRERGHPGEHCRNHKNSYNGQYENVWWPQGTIAREVLGKKSDSKIEEGGV